MRVGLWAGAASVLVFALAPMRAQSAGPSVRFEYERAAMNIPHWWVVVNASGDGSYEQDAAATVAAVKQPIHVSAATLKRIEAGAAQASTKSCETKLKNVAQTGKKTIVYRGAAGDVAGECTYNMADDAGLRDATAAFLAVQQTLEEGQRLAFLHRFDRLGLDAEMDALVEMVKDGRAIELGNIAAALQSLADDTAVLQRVRTKAATLLKQAQTAG